MAGMVARPSLPFSGCALLTLLIGAFTVQRLWNWSSTCQSILFLFLELLGSYSGNRHLCWCAKGLPVSLLLPHFLYCFSVSSTAPHFPYCFLHFLYYSPHFPHCFFCFLYCSSISPTGSSNFHNDSFLPLKFWILLSELWCTFKLIFVPGER